MRCESCGYEGEVELRWKGFTVRDPDVFQPKRRHLGAYCLNCGRWITWIPQTPDNLAELRRQELEQEGLTEEEVALLPRSEVDRGSW